MSWLRSVIAWSDFEAVFEGLSPTILFVKMVGALAGSLISIAYILPKGRREAFARLCVGLVTGLTFGGTAGVKLADFLGLLGKVSTIEVALVGAAFASLSAWWALGILERIAQQLPIKFKVFSSKTNQLEQHRTEKDG